LRWWDHWLKGVDTGIMDEPPLRVWLQDSMPPRGSYHERPGRWICEPSWPSPNVASRRYFLAPTGLRDSSTGEATVTVSTPQSTGLYAGDWDPFGNPADLPLDQRPEDGCSATFTSEPLSEPIAILGLPEVVLELATDQPLALVAVRLCDVHEDGASALITRGLLNLAHRGDNEHPQSLIPGVRQRIRLPLKAIGQVVLAGHRLRLAVSCTYWPWAWPSPRAAVLTLFLGPGCRLELPVRSGWERGPALPEFEPPEEATRPETITLAYRPGDHELVASLGDNRYQLLHRYPEFHIRLSDSGMEVQWLEQDTFTIVGDDPLSARVDCRRVVLLRRGDWSARQEVSSSMTASLDDFFVTASMQAFEGTHAVFANTWAFQVPRDHT
jgi:hypothetical protein